MRKRRKTASTRVRPLALAYVRVSTDDQVESGASLPAQRATLTAEAERRGWDLEIIADEGVSGKNLNRPGLQSALARLHAGDADALMAARLDRVSRSVADFAGLIARANAQRWQLVILDPDLDTATSAGKFTAHVLAAAAEYERDLIGARTREGMAQRRAEGVHVGRPTAVPVEVVADIVRVRTEGSTLAAIAAALNAAGVPTGHGAPSWTTSNVAGVLRSTSARRLATQTTTEVG